MKIAVLKTINLIKLLILKPKKFWQKQKETKGGGALFFSFLLPIIIIVTISVFVGDFFRRPDFFIQYPLLKSLRTFLLFILMYFIDVFFTNELMKTFGAQKNIQNARKLVIFSMVPFLIVSFVTGLFPFLYILVILGFYSFYVFGVGAKELLTFPENRGQSYILITILVNFFVYGFLSVLLSKLLAAYC